MSKLLISTGINPNDGNGDTLLAGASKVNSNFNEIYSSLGDGTNLNIGVGKTFISTNSDGNVGIGTTNSSEKLTVQGNIVANGISASSINLSGVSTLGDVQISSGIVSATSGIITYYGDGSKLNNLQWETSSSGIITSSSVGIGTTNPTSELYVVGNTLISGITTVGLGSTSSPPGNSQLTFELTSDTSLRIKVRGSDGVIRMADIVLS